MPATTVPVLSFQDLIQLSQEHEKHISAIKNEVAQEATDNLDDPEPLFDQLAEDHA